MKLKTRFYLIIGINVFITIVLFFHERLLTNLDKFTMPDSAELCKDIPEHLKTRFKLRPLPFDQIESDLDYLDLQPGGKWKPTHQPYYYKLAIIVPYRDRPVNLKLFLRNIHPFLVRQNIYYGVYVVEPLGNLTFNKGISMNAGFIQALEEDDYDCFIFHDVDLLPENDENIYKCHGGRPKLLAVAISAYGYAVEGYFKDKYFGGVTAFTKEQFIRVNGFSNLYFGWGLEDDDARERVLNKFSSVARLHPLVGRYFANCHTQQHRNPNRFMIYLKGLFYRLNTDGLNSINYNVAKIERTRIFTRIYINYENKG